MRVVEFSYSGRGEPNWPAEGKSAFINPRSMGDKIVGKYTGADASLASYEGDRYPMPTYRTKVRPGEMITLLGNQTYAALFRAAYPKGSASDDDVALVFIERARYPSTEDGLIDLASDVVVDALDYFVSKPVFTFSAEDKARVLLGVEE